MKHVTRLWRPAPWSQAVEKIICGNKTPSIYVRCPHCRRGGRVAVDRISKPGTMMACDGYFQWVAGEQAAEQVGG